AAREQPERCLGKGLVALPARTNQLTTLASLGAGSASSFGGIPRRTHAGERRAAKPTAASTGSDRLLPSLGRVQQIDQLRPLPARHAVAAQQHRNRRRSVAVEGLLGRSGACSGAECWTQV